MIVKVAEPQKLKEKLTERALVLYGMGTLGMKIAAWLDSQGIDYIFADRNVSEKQGVLGKRVVAPDTLKKDYPGANIVISSNLYYNEIRDFLLENGFDGSRIVPYTEFVPQNIVWTDLEDNIDWNLMKPSVEVISGWMDESIRSVADYGAGQMYLKSLLSPDVEYFPVDYIKRFDETILCDLNNDPFPALKADASVLNGVLEFLDTAEAFLTHVCTQTNKKIMVSYMTADKFPDENARRSSGYVSSLTEAVILKILEDGGFSLTEKTSDPIDPTDTIYLFERK